jgi:hypothetical protein
MNEWEARYKALAAGIEDELLVKNAETLVNAAMKKAISLPVPTLRAFEVIFYAMLDSVQRLRGAPNFEGALAALNKLNSEQRPEVNGD